MNNSPKLMTDEQYEFCKKQANELAKILLSKDVTDIFEYGNSIFVLETIVILTAGTFCILSDKINMDELTMLRGFCEQVELTIKANLKKPSLRLI